MSEHIIQLLSAAIQVYSLVLLARIVLSWIPDLRPTNPFVWFLYEATEPVLAPLRNVIPPLGGLDLSPLVVFFGLRLLNQWLLSLAAF